MNSHKFTKNGNDDYTYCNFTGTLSSKYSYAPSCYSSIIKQNQEVWDNTVTVLHDIKSFNYGAKNNTHY